MSGSVTVAGLGPGHAALVTPEVTEALARATDILGYIPYVARIPARAGLTLHPSDNREELARAHHALDIAAAGGRTEQDHVGTVESRGDLDEMIGQISHQFLSAGGHGLAATAKDKDKNDGERALQGSRSTTLNIE